MNISVLKSINSLFNTSSIDINQNDRMISSVSDLKNMQVTCKRQSYDIYSRKMDGETQSTDEFYKSTEVCWYR